MTEAGEKQDPALSFQDPAGPEVSTQLTGKNRESEYLGCLTHAVFTLTHKLLVSI